MTIAPATPQFQVPTADFLKSAADPKDWPAPGPPEVAFVGRSNVGKSALINLLVARKALVRTSATPGRTRLLNFFDVVVVDRAGARTALRLVDLPGFGYAQVAKSERALWRQSIEQYLSRREVLCAVALLVDARRGAEAEERDLAQWLTARGVAVVPVLTKVDKLAKHAARAAAQSLTAALGAKAVPSSAVSREGRELVWGRLLAAVAAGAPPEATPEFDDV